MFWILITAPLMIGAIAVAVVPVLVTSIREARLGYVDPSAPARPIRQAVPATAAVDFHRPDGGELDEADAA